VQLAAVRERWVVQGGYGALERVAPRVLIGAEPGSLGPAGELAVRGETQRTDLIAGQLRGERCFAHHNRVSWPKPNSIHAACHGAYAAVASAR
jgi:hypothetical protein